MKLKQRIFGLAISSSFFLSGGVHAQATLGEPDFTEDNNNIVGSESGNFKIRDADTGINSGGTVHNSNSYVLIDSVGQPVAGDAGTTPNDDTSTAPRIRSGQQVYDDTAVQNGTVLDIASLTGNLDVDVINVDLSNASLFVAWYDFEDVESNVAHYMYSVVERDANMNVLLEEFVPWTKYFGDENLVEESGLTLTTGNWYCYRVKGVNTAGLVPDYYTESDCVTPMFIKLTIDPSVVNLAPSVLGVEDTGSHNMTIETNSYDGYNLTIEEDYPLSFTHTNGTTYTILEEFLSRYDSPTVYGSDYGLAINILEDDLDDSGFVDPKWGTTANPLYSRITLESEPSSEKLANTVSDNTFPASGIIHEYDVNYIIRIRNTQPAGTYSSHVTYTAFAPLN